MKILNIVQLSAALVLWTPPAAAVELEPAFTYQGRFVDDKGQAIVGDVALRFQIFSSTGKCMLYEESQRVVLNKSQNGVASVKVGSMTANAKRTAADPGLKMKDIFSNETIISLTTPDCASGYAPKSGDARWLRVFINNGAKEIALSPDQVVASVPTALVAESLQGLTVGDLDKRYILNTRLMNLETGKLCYADGKNIKCDRDASTTVGAKGDKGDKGEQGVQGAAGAVGPKGATGDKGEQGVQGAAGAVGPKGATGDKGEQGIQGAAGAVGPKGATGDKGPQGPQGTPGLKGATGDRGLIGIAGAQGPMGLTGAMGPQGPKGDKGLDGRGLASLGQNCDNGYYLKGINTDGSLNCVSLDPITFKPSNIKIYTNVATTNISSISVFCPVGAARLSCSGTRNHQQQDTCPEENCGIVGIKPIVENGRQGCNTSIDTDAGTQVAAYAICYTELAQTVVAPVPSLTWVNRIGAENQAQTCARAGGAAVTNAGYGICASGERRPTQGKDFEHINYSYGIWGGTSTGGITDGNLCYAAGQKQDSDRTDIAVAFLCRK